MIREMIWNPRSTGVVIAPAHGNVGADCTLRHRAKKEKWAEADPEDMALEHNPFYGISIYEDIHTHHTDHF